MQLGTLLFPCALGRGGIKAIKREGDGATPRGRYRLRYVLYRSDLARPRTVLDTRAVRRTDGWCDSPSDRNYNRHVRLPYAASTERLWRDDRLYDVVVVIGYNDVPRVRHRGSAIFMHIARSGLRPTEGCVALSARDLRRLLSLIPKDSHIRILTK